MREGELELGEDVRQRTGDMRGISQLHLPMRRPEDVIPFLGSPGHWRDGRSAKLVAESWFAAKDRPELYGFSTTTRSYPSSRQGAPRSVPRSAASTPLRRTCVPPTTTESPSMPRAGPVMVSGAAAAWVVRQVTLDVD